jgi:hypothetical protein
MCATVRAGSKSNGYNEKNFVNSIRFFFALVVEQNQLALSIDLCEELRISRVSVATRSCLLGSTGGLLMPAVISVSAWLPVSSMLSACYCLGRHCVLKPLVTSGYDRIISSASTTKTYANLFAARNTKRSHVANQSITGVENRRRGVFSELPGPGGGRARHVFLTKEGTKITDCGKLMPAM